MGPNTDSTLRALRGATPGRQLEGVKLLRELQMQLAFLELLAKSIDPMKTPRTVGAYVEAAVVELDSAIAAQAHYLKLEVAR